MLKLTKDTTNNNIILTLTEKVTLSPVYFLFEFINDMTSTKYYFVCADGSSYPERYNSFTIVEGVDAPTNGKIILGDEGFYSYNIYEQSLSDNLDPDRAGDIVESGKVKLLGDNQTFTKNTIDTSFIVHDPTS